MYRFFDWSPLQNHFSLPRNHFKRFPSLACHCSFDLMVFNNISLLKIADPPYDGFVYLLSLRSVMTINIEVIADLLLLPSCLHSVSFDWIPIWFGFIYSKLVRPWFFGDFSSKIFRPTLNKVHMFWEGHKNLTKFCLIWISFKVQVFWEGHKNLKKIFHLFWHLLSNVKTSGWFFHILWPFQKTSTFNEIQIK